MKQVFNCYYTLPVLGKGGLPHLIATFVKPSLSRSTSVEGLFRLAKTVTMHALAPR